MPTLRWLTQRRAEYDSATADGRHQGIPELRERGEERARLRHRRNSILPYPLTASALIFGAGITGSAPCAVSSYRIGTYIWRWTNR